MARTRPIGAAEARQALLEAAERYVGVRRDAVVIMASGPVEVVRPAAAGPPPEGVNAYDGSLLAALADTPTSSRRLAHTAVDQECDGGNLIEIRQTPPMASGGANYA